MKRLIISMITHYLHFFYLSRLLLRADCCVISSVQRSSVNQTLWVGLLHLLKHLLTCPVNVWGSLSGAPSSVYLAKEAIAAHLDFCLPQLTFFRMKMRHSGISLRKSDYLHAHSLFAILSVEPITFCQDLCEPIIWSLSKFKTVPGVFPLNKSQQPHLHPKVGHTVPHNIKQE